MPPVPSTRPIRALQSILLFVYLNISVRLNVIFYPCVSLLYLINAHRMCPLPFLLIFSLKKKFQSFSFCPLNCCENPLFYCKLCLLSTVVEHSLKKRLVFWFSSLLCKCVNLLFCSMDVYVRGLRVL